MCLGRVSVASGLDFCARSTGEEEFGCTIIKAIAARDITACDKLADAAQRERCRSDVSLALSALERATEEPWRYNYTAVTLEYTKAVYFMR